MVKAVHSQSESSIFVLWEPMLIATAVRNVFKRAFNVAKCLLIYCTAVLSSIQYP